MENKPLVTVITVTYNAAGEIGKTLDSLKEQTFKDFEHLIIDGSSTDATLSIVEKANLPQTKILSEPDKGLYDAMNKGLRAANGEYVIFLNAGDRFHDANTLALYGIHAATGSDIIYGDTIIVDSEGKKIGDRHLKAPETLVRESFSKGMLICHQAFMVRKALASEYDLDFRFSADYDWCVRCIEKSSPDKCVNLHEVTVDYLSDGLTDKHKSESLKERFKIMCRHYGFVKTALNHIGFVFRALRRGRI